VGVPFRPAGAADVRFDADWSCAIAPLGGRSSIRFADGYPLLLISQASLDDLNTRTERTHRMAQFRPNLVVTGTGASRPRCCGTGVREHFYISTEDLWEMLARLGARK
jgi:hypothetical protein